MPIFRSWISHPLEHEPGSALRRPGVAIAARTAGEVLEEAGRILAVRFEPHDSEPWFRVSGIPEFGDSFMLTDISIERDGVKIYPMRPRRDASFPIYDSDIVSVFIITD